METKKNDIMQSGRQAPDNRTDREVERGLQQQIPEPDSHRDSFRIPHFGTPEPESDSGEGRNHIDFDKGKIILSKQKNKRINEPFILFPELEKALKEHIEQNRSRIWACGEYLFWSKYQNTYRKLQRSTVLSMISQYRRKAGLTEVYGFTKDGRKKHRLSMHSTRHYAINEWGRLCVEKKGIYDTNTISCLSRHTNPASLESYRVLNEDIRRVVTQTLLG